MSDDGRVPVGAAAPPRARIVESVVLLDALWVAVVGLTLVATSFLSLGDIGDGSSSTGDSGLRIFSLAVPVAAVAVAVVGAARKSGALTAAATGMLAPAVSLVGLVSSTHFLDRAAAYAEAGAAVGIVAASIGVAALIRWYVYHPLSLQSDEVRPIVPLAWGLAGAGFLVALLVVITAMSDAGATTIQFIGQLFFALVVAIATIVAAAVRTLRTFVVAASAAVTQLVAVLLAIVDDSDTKLDSTVTAWTSALGVVALIAAAGVALAGTRQMVRDDERSIEVGTESWRWTSTETADK
jgi:hypothetical protein